jgi:hypothetical protein
MRYLSMLVIIAVVFLIVLTFASVAAAASYTLRPVDPVAAETLDFAVARSAMVRSLTTAIESSNLIVHIASSNELPLGIGGTTRFVFSSGGYRYVRITVAAALPLRIRGAILGHELQHARELAESTADDPISVRRLFEQTGYRTGAFFDTRAALDAERHVRMELLGVLQAEPVVKLHHQDLGTGRSESGPQVAKR